MAAALGTLTAGLAGGPGAAARTRAAGTPLVRETFTGATADTDFTAVGSACLTGAPSAAGPGPGDHALGGCPEGGTGPVPPNGGAPHGYLRLTDSSGDQSGAVLYNHALPASEGLDVAFDQWQYGSTTPANPADGISFFLVDGDTTLTHPGAFGGSLGYAQKLPDDNPANALLPGVDRGYLGVGLDVLGNYFGDWEQRGNGCARRSPAGTQFRIPGPGANMVTVRGPGDGVEGYCFLTASTSNFSTTGPWPSTLPGKLQGPLTSLAPGTTPLEAQEALEPSRRRVEVRLSPAPDPVLTVTVDFNDGTGPHQVISAPAPEPVPATYTFGFAGSTGGFTDVHLIRNVLVSTERPLPALDLVKQVHEPLPGLLVPGTRVPYDFLVRNSGGTEVTGLAVSDPTVGAVSCPTTTLAVGESTTCTGTYTIARADVERGFVTNTAQASATAQGRPLTSPESRTTVPIAQPPGIEVQKRVDTPGPYAVGDTVGYAYLVSNTGGHRLDDVRVNDDRVTGITCEDASLAPQGDPGDSTVCRGTYLITRQDAENGSVTNHATAAGTVQGQTITSPPAEATLPIAGPPRITVHKRVDSRGPFVPGDTVAYSYLVTNDGGTPLRDVEVVDDHVAGVTCEATTLAPGQGTVCHGAYTVTDADADAGHVTNRARAAAVDDHGNTVVSPPAEATVPVECPPEGKPHHTERRSA